MSYEETIYLAGPINGCNDDEAHGWREKFRALLPGFNYLDPMVRDYRGVEDLAFEEIVVRDVEDIQHSDILLAYCWQPSWGTAMEIMWAFMHDIATYIVVPEGRRISPWLRYHACPWLGSSLEDAAAAIRRDFY